MRSWEGGWEATAASMHRCSLLNVSISSNPPTPHPPPLPHLTFLSLLCEYITTRWHLSYKKLNVEQSVRMSSETSGLKTQQQVTVINKGHSWWLISF